jgi:hypothetical protein
VVLIEHQSSDGLESCIVVSKADATLSQIIDAFTTEHGLGGVPPAIEQCEISGKKGRTAA